MGTIAKLLHRNNVLYVEPNLLEQNNLTSESENGDIYTSPNLEDYAIFCDLEVELVSRIREAKQGFIKVRYSTDNGEVKIGRFMQGSEYGNTQALTTDYSDIGYSDLTQNLRTTELFGINSIKISYDAWMSPKVEIQFTDIRGGSLFGVEEITHNLVRADGMGGLSSNNEDKDLTDSFFRAFFTFPYPRFRFIVKGYYGQPVSYDLALYDFKVSFDSKTGNFNANATFLGFMFGIIGDITMSELAASISFKKDGSQIGRNYWDEQVKNGRFTYKGEKLLRLSEIAYKYQKYKKELNTSLEEIHQEVEDVEKISDKSDTLVTLFNDYVKELDKFGDTVTSYTKKTIKNNINTYLSQNTSNATAIANVMGYVNTREMDEQKTFASDIAKFCEKTLKNIGYKLENGVLTLRIPDDSVYEVKQYGNGEYYLKSLRRYVRHLNDNNLSADEYVKAKQQRKRNLNNDQYLEPKFTLNEENYGKEGWLLNDERLLKFPNYIKNGAIDSHFPLKDYTSCTKADDGTFNGSCLEDLPKIKDKKVILKFRDNTPFYKFESDVNSLKKKNVTSKVSIKIDKEKVGKNNIELYNTYLKGKHDALLQALKDLKSTLSNDNSLDRVIKHLSYGSSGILNTMPSYDGTYVAMPVKTVNKKRYISGVGYDVWDVVAVPVSIYKFNLKELEKKINGIKNTNSEDTLKDKQEKAASELQNKYLNFSTSIPFFMKCLWAHVETFLDMCIKTNSNIVNNKRTVKDMGLNEDNSSLASTMYKAPNESVVGAFPEILTKESINGTPSTRIVHGWIGDVYPDAEECNLVDNLLQGASQFHSWVHSQDDAPPPLFKGTDRDIRISLYTTLKQFFEKWIHAIPQDKFLEEWGVDTYFDKHFLFIDTYYEPLPENIGVDVLEVSKMIEGIFIHSQTSLMDFITTLLQKVNTILQPTQGFMLNDIENGDKINDYYKKLFSLVPVNEMKEPEITPYFVVIYRGDPSQHLDTGDGDEDDGFLIGYDDNIHKVPISITQKDRQTSGGYVIPAIGIDYGKQYQSYFYDISVDMSKPMANEVSLAAQFELCGIATDSNGGNEQNLTLGQDLYTVYANNSYTCTVNMLGCMWIQPLMYFQLNNIPMFRGTYMIQKVSHDISPGNMVTTFTGVRMSRYSSPFVNKKIFQLVETGAYSENNGIIDTHPIASYDNDCEHEKFDPNESLNGLGTDTFTTQWLDRPFGKNFPRECISDSLSGWYSLIKDLPTKFALSCIIMGENNKDELSRDLHSALIFNRFRYISKGETDLYKVCKKDFWSSKQWTSLNTNNNSFKTNVSPYLHNYSKNSNSDAVKSIVKVFTKSPNVVRGVMDGNGSNGKDEKGKYNKHTITQKDMQRIYWTAKQKSNCSLIGGHKGSAYYIQTTKDCWQPVQPKNEDKKFHERLVNCIKRTFNQYEGLGSENFDSLFRVSVNLNDKKITFDALKKDNAIATPLLTDILLNCYNEYIQFITCRWGENTKDISKDSHPNQIVIKYSNSTQKITKIGFRKGNVLFEINSNFPTAFLQVLKKKFNDLKDQKANAYISNPFVQ